MVRVDEPGEEDLSYWNAKYKPRELQLALYWPMEINWIVTLKKGSESTQVQMWHLNLEQRKSVQSIISVCVCVPAPAVSDETKLI